MRRYASRRWGKSHVGFSLVEVVISIAIVGFTMMSLLGMVSIGLVNFKQAMNNTVQSQIVQTLTSELDLTDFNNLTNSVANGGVQGQSYYYDAEGNFLTNATSGTSVANAIYTATINLQPVSTTSNTFPLNLTSLTSSAAPEAYNAQIQITNISQPNLPQTNSVIIANKNN